MTNRAHDKDIEALLFYKAQPVTKAWLAKQLAITADDLHSALQALTERLSAGAIRLLETDTEVSLVTAPPYDQIIERIRRDELKRDIGKAGAETLAIILYRGPVTRGEIDRIRGVNSGYILRTLMVRGLIERSSNSKRTEYQATSELLAHLGITHKSALPQYEAIMQQLETFEVAVAAEEA